MRFSRPIAALLGVLTLIPLVYLAVFLVFVVPKLSSVGRPGGITQPLFGQLTTLSFGLGTAVIGLSLALLAFFAAFAHRTTNVPSDKKGLWVAVLLFGNIIAMPVFWYIYVWRTRQGSNITAEPIS